MKTLESWANKDKDNNNNDPHIKQLIKTHEN